MAETKLLVRGGTFARTATQGLVGAFLTLIAACTPTVQQALAEPADAHGPRFDVEGGRFYSFDGAALGLSTWAPADGTEPWAVILGLHGMNDYGEAFFPAGPWFAERGVVVYAYDARGFGRSPQRGVWGGERLMTEDVRTAVRVARARHPDAIIAVVGDSMGAATAISTFASDDAPDIDRLVLAAPAVWGWSSLPDMYAMTLWVGAHTFPWRPVSPPRNVTQRIMASDNIEMLRRLGRDPNMIFRTRIDAVYGLVGLMENASRRIADLKTKNVIMLYGAHDQIIPRPAADLAAARLPAHARSAYYENGYHMLMRDLQAEVVYEDVLSYLRDPAAPLPSAAPPLEPPHAPDSLAQANR